MSNKKEGALTQETTYGYITYINRVKTKLTVQASNPTEARIKASIENGVNGVYNVKKLINPPVDKQTLAAFNEMANINKESKHTLAKENEEVYNALCKLHDAYLNAVKDNVKGDKRYDEAFSIIKKYER